MRREMKKAKQKAYNKYKRDAETYTMKDMANETECCENSLLDDPPEDNDEKCEIKTEPNENIAENVETKSEVNKNDEDFILPKLPRRMTKDEIDSF